MSFNFNDFLVTFMSIIFEAMPFIVLGAIVSGALEELLPQQFFTRWLPSNRLLAIMGSSMMGMLLPMCECGIVPVMRRLMRKGVPESCAITYMLSAPVINPIVLSSTALAFWGFYNLAGVPGLAMVLLRAGAAFITAVTVGLIVDRLARRGVPLVRENAERTRLVESVESNRLLQIDHVGVGHDHCHEEHCHDHAHDHHHEHSHDHGHSHDHHHHDHEPKSLLDRLTAIADIALNDFLDIAAFLVIGAALAATVNTALSRDRLDYFATYDVGSVAGMMGLAFLLSLCSEADAFVAANLVSFRTGAKVAFLVLGPMLDVKLLIMYRWVFTARTVRVIVGTIVLVVFVLGNIVNMGERLLASSAG